MIARRLYWLVPLVAMVAAAGSFCLAADTATGAASLSNGSLHVAVRAQDGAFELWSVELHNPVVAARIGAEVNHRWLWSDGYPKHQTVPSNFQTVLGSGNQIKVMFTGLANQPDLDYILRLYDNLPFGDLQVGGS